MHQRRPQRSHGVQRRIAEPSSEKAFHTIASLNVNDELLKLQGFDFVRRKGMATEKRRVARGVAVLQNG
jgi:hypothetical protein